jgi:hypothetical protein
VQQQLRERLVRELGQPLFDRVHAYLLTLQSEDDVAAGAGDMQQELESLLGAERLGAAASVNTLVAMEAARDTDG